MEELRVDWLVGGGDFGGAVIGELTYQGAGFSMWEELGGLMARGYLAAVKETLGGSSC